eukprot:CAMPEP_0178950328 /NCGR_PEP_ID=MMETSP0789-20121207/6587_1 /TAXON_ID=3005 /ORGANISM="Rhizosolenia setigera, Strain CCMP 1694" /LENGTH=723 /DNA_ID=CAMNT_0020631033 /DNA_START=238 /DNA_END=2410 /DNA_ORIENTATION=+
MATSRCESHSRRICQSRYFHADPALPSPGENLTLLPNQHPIIDVPGGKGCNQAIASQKLSLKSTNLEGIVSSSSSTGKVAFIGRIGSDDGASIIQKVLQEHGVDISHMKSVDNMSTGRGFVFLEAETGRVSAVVSGGSNMYGWDDFEHLSKGDSDALWNDLCSSSNSSGEIDNQTVHCLLLQREVKEFVNRKLAQEAKERGVIVLQDIGGEDREIDQEMMSLCDYIMPNLTELKRLVKSCTGQEINNIDLDAADVDNHEPIVQAARVLQDNGAKNVLVTLGERGSLLLQENGNVIYQPPSTFGEDEKIVDETGAGDCYRAGFAVALSECYDNKVDKNDLLDSEELKQCMKFASGAGALACLKEGAVPSIPTREEVKAFLKKSYKTEEAMKIPSGGGLLRNEEFPYMFGSRLNSMKDRPELWEKPVDNVREWVKRQGTVKGLGCVDFNYPQHFHSWTSKEAKAALEEVGLKAGAVCLRYPSKFARGAMNHPDEELRREAIEMTKEAAKVAKELGCNEVVVWSAYDGYDYAFQVDYKEKWDQLVEAFRECCDAHPDIKWSLEYKPTDENTRFFTVPSTGAAILLVKEINRPNMGLTLDVGHMLMSGENPGQSIAMAGDKLFGIQLNDGYTRLAAEDGMMFGSIHPAMALEIMYQLQQNDFSGHFYFDTFPQRSDPVKEAEYNIEHAKKFYNAAKLMKESELKRIMSEHDAIGALKAVNDALKSVY